MVHIKKSLKKKHTLGDLQTTEMYFSHFWRLGSPRSRRWLILMRQLSDESLLPGSLTTVLLLCLHRAEGAGRF